MPENRLINEKSPYLLQHAHNPVDWYPWGEEAFEMAKRQDKPIFLSIGYATCHWCHVMARESFDNSEVAKRLNDVFICIKVDTTHIIIYTFHGFNTDEFVFILSSELDLKSSTWNVFKTETEISSFIDSFD